MIKPSSYKGVNILSHREQTELISCLMGYNNHISMLLPPPRWPCTYAMKISPMTYTSSKMTKKLKIQPRVSAYHCHLSYYQGLHNYPEICNTLWLIWVYIECSHSLQLFSFMLLIPEPLPLKVINQCIDWGSKRYWILHRIDCFEDHWYARPEQWD